MKFAAALTYVPLLACAADAAKPLVTPKSLVSDIGIQRLIADSQRLQRFAYKYPERNRVFGGAAHEDTIYYIYNTLRRTGAYDVRLQPQKHIWSQANQNLTIGNRVLNAGGATYGPSGDVIARLQKVDELGCFAENFPAAVVGKIAFIERGNCTFSDKVANAGAAGAVGAIIYNNEKGMIAGTLGTPKNPLGPYVPIVFVTQRVGQNVVDRLAGGQKLKGHIYVDAQMEKRLTYNVIATTKSGNQNKVITLGAHTDSVNEGPGINDDGSGTVGNLEVARQLAKYSVKNAVRFCFWTAEEFGLLGSTFYVNSLSKAEKKKIAMNINIDMIASSNYVYSIYDGDGSRFNMSGPPGSAQIEKLFEDFYDARNIPHIPTAFDGRSDYQAFIANGIPAGGIFSGADEIKTPRQQKLFGGTAGLPQDVNYHTANDTFQNEQLEPFGINVQAVAYAVATYARDLSSIPPRGTMPTKRSSVSTPIEKRAEEEGVRMPCNRFMCPSYE